VSGLEGSALARYLAPVTDELSVNAPLAHDGAIPPVLDGLFVRNGPNPLRPDAEPSTWADGDGMVHAVDVTNGAAVSYRNRWVRTRRYSDQTLQRPVRGPEDPVDGPANGHALWHGGRLLALDGSGFPYRLTTELATVYVDDFDGTLTSPICARPRIDPVTGAMTSFGVDPFGPPYLRYHEQDPTGEIVHLTELVSRRVTYSPDFGVSESRVVLFETPTVLDARLEATRPALPYRIEDETDLRVAILDRGADGASAVWLDTDPCLPLEVVNAWDDGTTLVLDLLCADALPTGAPETGGARLQRWWLDPAGGSIKRRALDDRPVALCAIDPGRQGRAYRYVYGVESGPAAGTAVIRYDLARDEALRWDPGVGRAVGSPVYVPDPDARADDEGWLLVPVYDAGRDASDLVVLDASAMARPEALIHLPARMPPGYHGTFVPADRFR
jgi:carotenoid cleavage dioxygenase